MPTKLLYLAPGFALAAWLLLIAYDMWTGYRRIDARIAHHDEAAKPVALRTTGAGR